MPGEPRPDVVVAIVDASNLDRNLYLTTQALEARRAGRRRAEHDRRRRESWHEDRRRPSRRTRRAGRADPGEQEARASTICGKPWPGRGGTPGGAEAARLFPKRFEREVAELQQALERTGSRSWCAGCCSTWAATVEQRLCRQFGPGIGERLQAARLRLAAAGCPVPAVEARIRYAWIRKAITAGCVTGPRSSVTWTDRFDRVLTHKFWGTLVFLAMMFLVFQSIFTWAQPLMDSSAPARIGSPARPDSVLPPGR